MPTSNENRVRVEFLSKMTATPRGPSSGLRAERVRLQLAASASTSACSVGRQVVVTQEMPGHHDTALSEHAGQRGEELVDLAPR